MKMWIVAAVASFAVAAILFFAAVDNERSQANDAADNIERGFKHLSTETSNGNGVDAVMFESIAGAAFVVAGIGLLAKARGERNSESRDDGESSLSLFQ